MLVSTQLYWVGGGGNQKTYADSQSLRLDSACFARRSALLMGCGCRAGGGNGCLVSSAEAALSACTSQSSSHASGTLGVVRRAIVTLFCWLGMIDCNLIVQEMSKNSDAVASWRSEEKSSYV